MPHRARASYPGLVSTTAFLSLIVWALISLFIVKRGLLFASNDDYPRLALALHWSREPYFFTDGYYWLPLPFWYDGLWHRLLSRLGGFVHWYIPASTLMMALACWGLLLLTFELNRPEGARFRPRRRFQAVLAALALAITLPFAWRLTATGLAEPVFIAEMSWLGWLMVRFVRRPGGLPWVFIFLLCEALMFTRYEGWPVAFVAWLVACHFAHRGPRPRPRLQWQLLAGGACFVFVPLFIMWNMAVTPPYDPLFFLKLPKIWSPLVSNLHERPMGYRLAYLSWLGLRQGWVVLALFAVGIFQGWRRREFWVVFMLSALLWGVYYQMAVSNSFGGNPPDRFCIGALWMLVPIAARGAVAAMRLGRWPAEPRWIGWIARTALAAAILAQLTFWNGKKNWSGPIGPPELFETADRLSLEARDPGCYAVVADPVALGDKINLLRIYMEYMGATRVMVESEWHPPNPPVAGKFYYVTPRPIPGMKEQWHFAGQEIYAFKQWPPVKGAE